MRQVQASTYKYDGKIAAGGIGDRWFVDLIDFTAAPSDGGKKTSLKRTKDNEAYILVVQDVFSRFLWAEALMTKTPEEVAQAFEKSTEGRHYAALSDFRRWSGVDWRICTNARLKRNR